MKQMPVPDKWIQCLMAVAMMVLSACASVETQQAQQPEIQRISPAELEALIPAATASVTLDELVADSKAGLTPDEIIAKIKATDSRYELTPEQVLTLNKQGLDIRVLNYIDEANRRARQNVLAEEMNKRQKAQEEKARELERERDFARMRALDAWRFGYPWVGPWGGPGFYRWGLRYGW